MSELTAPPTAERRTRRNRGNPTRWAVRAATALVLAGASLAAVTAGGSAATRAATPATSATRPANVPAVRHVFVINIENEGYAATWGSASEAPYLAKTLRGKGVLLTNYYATAHNSEPNYVAQISGQGPNPQMQADCQLYSPFVGSGTVAPGQAIGSGCVFPASVASLPTQLNAKGLFWKGYMEDMGSTSCRHPQLNTQDSTQKAKVGDQYAVRHDPFMYFAAITGSKLCTKQVVGLRHLTTDLKSVRTTPNFSYLTPNLCNDGHDEPCVDGRPGGLTSVNAWLKVWVPRILASPAFRANGMLVITADESDSPQSDATACCGEGAAPNSPLPGIVGPGGGHIGALVISHWTKGGTSSATPYNHYSLLASLENIYALPYLGYAGTAKLNRFGRDVYNSAWK